MDARNILAICKADVWGGKMYHISQVCCDKQFPSQTETLYAWTKKEALELLHEFDAKRGVRNLFRKNSKVSMHELSNL